MDELEATTSIVALASNDLALLALAVAVSVIFSPEVAAPPTEAAATSSSLWLVSRSPTVQTAPFATGHTVNFGAATCATEPILTVTVAPSLSAPVLHTKTSKVAIWPGWTLLPENGLTCVQSCGVTGVGDGEGDGDGVGVGEVLGVGLGLVLGVASVGLGSLGDELGVAVALGVVVALGVPVALGVVLALAAGLALAEGVALASDEADVASVAAAASFAAAAFAAVVDGRCAHAFFALAELALEATDVRAAVAPTLPAETISNPAAMP